MYMMGKDLHPQFKVPNDSPYVSRHILFKTLGLKQKKLKFIDISLMSLRDARKRQVNFGTGDICSTKAGDRWYSDQLSFLDNLAAS